MYECAILLLEINFKILYHSSLDPFVTAPVPMESMLPMPPMPPVGFQLVRDPSTGQILFLPTTTTIGKFNEVLQSFA